MAFTKSIPIQFHYLVSPFSFPNRSGLKQFIGKMFSRQGRQLEAVNFIFCSDDYLLELNQEHLKHNTFTDIITFELSPQGQPLLADIYISIERVKENARLFGVSFKEELHRVIFHGALHLCGFKDKKPGEQRVMRKMEAEWLKKYFN